MSRDSAAAQRRWATLRRLPYPLLSDERHEAGDAFHVVRRLGIGGFAIELFRRTTFLIDTHGVVSAVWGNVTIRGHALQVLEVARVLGKS